MAGRTDSHSPAADSVHPRHHPDHSRSPSDKSVHVSPIQPDADVQEDTSDTLPAEETTSTMPSSSAIHNVAHCLEIVRNSEPGQAPPNAVAVIERAMAETWQRVLANPNGYVMTDTEFAIFNFFRTRYEAGGNKPLAQRATARYWDSKGHK